MARGVDRRRIFVDAEDYRTYTRLLATVVARQGWRLLSYCLMPNHVHLVIETPEPNLGNGMQWLQARYARAFNARHGRKGHLFEETYLSPLITSEAALIKTVKYVAANPVAARLCDSPAEWEWCSEAQLATADRDWIAHARLRERLHAAAGFDCYADLIAACRAPRPRRKAA